MRDQVKSTRQPGQLGGGSHEQPRSQEVLDDVARQAADAKSAGRGCFRFFEAAMDAQLEAARQLEICHWIAARTAAARILVCPTYYTDDPILDQPLLDFYAGYQVGGGSNEPGANTAVSIRGAQSHA